jgi:hypothetical protein
MVKVETVDFTLHGVVFPADRVGIVAAQPWLSLTEHEPFACNPAQRAAQLAVIDKTLELANVRPHGQPKTHFTLFPEYSIPGLEGAQRVDTAMADADWPTGTVVIGGVDGLTQAEYATLVAQQNSHVDVETNAANRVKADKWVNCGIVWVKDGGGVVHRWIQPKLTPAWAEADIAYQAMFQGGSIFLFKGRLSNQASYHFSMLVCFDWISSLEERRLWRHVLDDLARQSALAGGELSVSWFFVIQHNPKPNHVDFLQQVPPFFDQNALPTVRRERACVVFANTAGLPKPGRVQKYGSSSLIFSASTLFEKPTCPMTVANGGPDLRGNSTILNPYHDVVFREGGACIYSFVQINPGSLVAGPAGRSPAIENAEVFPVDDTDDPRAPSAAVPASVKWLNDELDDVQSLKAKFPLSALRDSAEAAHETTVEGFRRLPPAKIAFVLNTNPVADKWRADERSTLNLLVHTQDILGIGYATAPVPDEGAFPIVTIDGHQLDVIVIAGPSHDECWKQAEKSLALGSHQSLVVTRDFDNTIWRRESRSILQGDPADVGQDQNITDPISNVLHISYQELLASYLDAQNTAGLESGIRAKLA